MSLELQEYSKYINASKLLENHHIKHASYSDDKTIAAIDSWVKQNIEPSENRPLLVTGSALSGKKTLLVQWVRHHRNFNVQSQIIQSENIVLADFAIGKCKYSEVIYRVLSQLREILLINQKVETNEQKLRRFFPYWMEICNRILQKRTLEEGKSKSRKIIIVISDIDRFTNDRGQPLLPGFWLPETLPCDIRVIVSARQDSLAAVSLKLSKVITLNQQRLSQIKTNLIRQSPISIGKLLEKHNEKVTLLYCRLINSLFSEDNPFFDTLIQFDIGKLKEFSVIELCRETVDFWSNRLLSKKIMEETMKLLCFSKKGLTPSEICFLAGLRPSEFKKFTCVVEALIYSYQGVWCIPDEAVRNSLIDIFKLEQPQIALWHLHMAKGLKQLPQSLRKLEEQTYHLFEGNGLPELKETVSQMENFLLLFNWQTKYELCHYWKHLELKHSFDPVFEYNRSLTTFQMHSYPSQQNLFRLLLQLSRFFIEYAHFEMYNTPNFRHPLIKGDEDELIALHVLDEFKTMGMLMERQVKYFEKDKRPNESHLRSSLVDKSLEEMTRHNTIIIQNKIQQIVQDLQNKKPIRLRELKLQKTDRYVYVSENRQWVETISIDIPANKIRFQQYYLKQLEDYFKEAHLELSQTLSNSRQDAQIPIKDITNEKLSPLTLETILPYYQFEEEKYHLSFKEPKNYYYKQWLWIQFPWISMSLDCDYSRLIRKCIKSSTHYIEVSEEKELTEKAMIMSLETHKRKCLKFNRKTEKQLGLGNQRNTEQTERMPLKRSHPSQGSRLSSVSRQNQDRQFHLDRELERYKVQHISSKTQQERGNSQNTFLTGIFNSNSNNNNNQIRQPLPTLRSHRDKGKNGDLLELKRQYNLLTYENSRLEKKIVEMQRLQENYVELDHQKEEDEMMSMLKKASKKGDELRHTLAKALIHQQKLRTIIEICDQNKICNSESVGPLHNFVNNLKAMIECTKVQNKRFKESLKTTERQFKHQVKILNEELQQLNMKGDNKQSELSVIQHVSRYDHQGNVQPLSQLQDKSATNLKLQKSTCLSYKSTKNPVLLTVEEFQNQHGQLSLTNPKIVKFCEAVEKRKCQQKRMIELELQRDTLVKKLTQLGEQSQNSGQPNSMADTTTNQPASEFDLHDLQQQLEMMRRKRAAMSTFVDSVETRLNLLNPSPIQV